MNQRMGAASGMGGGRWLPRFSLRSLLLLTAVIACAAATYWAPPPWQKTHVLAGRGVELISGYIGEQPGPLVAWLAYSPDGARVAALYEDAVVEVWDVGAAERIRAVNIASLAQRKKDTRTSDDEVASRLFALTGESFSYNIARDPESWSLAFDGTRLFLKMHVPYVAETSACTLFEIDLMNGQIGHIIGVPCETGAVLPPLETDGKTFASLFYEGLLFHDAKTGEIMRRVKEAFVDSDGREFPAAFGNLGLSPDYRYALKWQRPADYKLPEYLASFRVKAWWDSNTWIEHRRFPFDPNSLYIDLFFIPDSTMFLIWHTKSLLEVWDAETGQLAQKFESIPLPLESLQAQLAGSRILLAFTTKATGDERAYLLDLESGRDLLAHVDHESWGDSLAASWHTLRLFPDGERLLSTDGHITYVHDAARGHFLVVMMNRPDYAVTNGYDHQVPLAIAPDGQSFVTTALMDNSIVIFRRNRPEWWWGSLYLPQTWATAALALALLWSLLRDAARYKSLARTAESR